MSEWKMIKSNIVFFYVLRNFDGIIDTYNCIGFT